MAVRERERDPVKCVRCWCSFFYSDPPGLLLVFRTHSHSLLLIPLTSSFVLSFLLLFLYTCWSSHYSLNTAGILQSIVLFAAPSAWRTLLSEIFITCALTFFSSDFRKACLNIFFFQSGILPWHISITPNLFIFFCRTVNSVLQLFVLFIICCVSLESKFHDNSDFCFYCLVTWHKIGTTNIFKWINKL